MIKTPDLTPPADSRPMAEGALLEQQICALLKEELPRLVDTIRVIHLTYLAAKGFYDWDAHLEFYDRPQLYDNPGASERDGGWGWALNRLFEEHGLRMNSRVRATAEPQWIVVDFEAPSADTK